MDPLAKMRKLLLEEWDFLHEDYQLQALRICDQIELQINDDLVKVDQAAGILGVSERTVWNLADDIDTPLWRYNRDGTRKTTTRRTSTFFRKSELVKYRDKNSEVVCR